MILYIKENFTDHLRHFPCKEKRQKVVREKDERPFWVERKGWLPLDVGTFRVKWGVDDRGDRGGDEGGGTVKMMAESGGERDLLGWTAHLCA